MPTGTTLNNVFAARIHKSNAVETRDEAADMLRFYRERLLALAAYNPPTLEIAEEKTLELRQLVEDMQGVAVEEFLANYVAENPDDCQDELVPEDWPEGDA